MSFDSFDAFSNRVCVVSHFSTDPDSYLSFNVTASITEVQRARKAGCWVCATVLDGIDSFERGWAKRHAHDSISWIASYGSPLRVTLPTEEWKCFKTLEIYQALGSVFGIYDPLAPIVNIPFLSSRDIIHDTTSDLAYTRISAWLTDCLARHNCAVLDATFMPSRVLDTAVGSGSKYRVRLAEPAKSQTKAAPYVALSYCWGSNLKKVLMTTKGNIKAHCRGVDIRSLPATIQDAVRVCRGLGLRYLWVDALCIVQDDTEDWQREAARMRLVYSNAHVTIAAHAAASCKDGFLGKQSYGKPSWQREFWSGSRKKGHRFHVRAGAVPSPQSEGLPLDKRGWTLQEVILSPRIIHYTGAELVWECGARHFCECGHVEEGGFVHPGKPMAKTEFLKDPAHDKKSQLSDDGWMRLVKRYSARDLSFGSDKLVAISGLVQMAVADAGSGRIDTGQPTVTSPDTVHDPLSLSTTYLAGLFLAAFPRHLLWNTSHQNLDRAFLPSNCRPSPYRAPSWSWASIDTAVEYNDCLFETERSHIVVYNDKCFCVPAVANDPTGAVIAGELVVEGLVAKVWLLTAEDKEYSGFGSFYDSYYDQSTEISDAWNGRATVVRGCSGVMKRVSCDVRREIEVREGDQRFDCWVYGKCPRDDSGWCDKCRLAPKESLEDHFSVLEVATYSRKLPPSSDIQKLDVFLVLKRSAAVDGAWERIGIGMEKDGNEKNNLFKEGKRKTIRII